MSGIIVRPALADLPTATRVPGGSLGLLTTDEELYIDRGGAWARMARASEIPSGAVTLAGDAVGPSGANTVVAISGAAGVVAMHGNEIRYDEGTNCIVAQAFRTTNAIPHDMFMRPQGPFAGATGFNRNPGNFVVDIAAPAAGGTPGYAKFNVSAATVATLGSFGLRLGGDDFQAAERLHLHGNILFDETTVGPIIRHGARTTNFTTSDVTHLGQDAFAGATGSNRNGGGFAWSTGVPAAGGAHGKYLWAIAGNSVFQVQSGAVLLDGGVSLLSTGTMRINPNSVASGAGRDVLLRSGSTSDAGALGGEFKVILGEGGLGSARFLVATELADPGTLQVAKLNGNYTVSVGAVDETNVPADGISPGLFLKNALIGTMGIPVGGMLLGASGGNPLFWFEEGSKLKLIGGLQDGHAVPQPSIKTVDVDYIDSSGTLWELALELVVRTH